MNILGKRYFFFGLSLLIIISGLVLLFLNRVPLSIDFTGGQPAGGLLYERTKT